MAFPTLQKSIFFTFSSNPLPSHPSLIPLIRVYEVFEVASLVMRFRLSASPRDTVSFADYPFSLFSTRILSAALGLDARSYQAAAARRALSHELWRQQSAGRRVERQR